MLIDKECLWYCVLKACYGEEGGRLKEGGRHSSAWWRSLCRFTEGIDEGVGSWFENNTRRVVGPKATQVISIGLGRTMERKRNSEHLKKTAPEAEVLLK
ncbi:hypothetical protein MTR_5g090360 [Medicago truncatula]|uniref:Uncharacterized protein n=1 Tax=Medicago truncatula TaxID=3880 RepID=G7KD10_MEDTR|nr:hypothetical protein MTR_5g090360 [Medicago truncatula]